jgi:hypothetical protein
MEVIAERHDWNPLTLSLIDGPCGSQPLRFESDQARPMGFQTEVPDHRLVMAVILAFTKPVVR